MGGAHRLLDFTTYHCNSQVIDSQLADTDGVPGANLPCLMRCAYVPASQKLCLIGCLHITFSSSQSFYRRLFQWLFRVTFSEAVSVRNVTEATTNRIRRRPKQLEICDGFASLKLFQSKILIPSQSSVDRAVHRVCITFTCGRLVVDACLFAVVVSRYTQYGLVNLDVISVCWHGLVNLNFIDWCHYWHKKSPLSVSKHAIWRRSQIMDGGLDGPEGVCWVLFSYEWALPSLCNFPFLLAVLLYILEKIIYFITYS